MARNPSNPYSLKVDLNEETMAVDITIRERSDDGDELTPIANESFPTSKIEASLIPKVTLYGWSKILQDRASGETGLNKVPRMREVEEAFAQGNWELERRGGGPTVSAEVEALAQLKNVDVGAIQKTLQGLTADQRERALTHPTVVERAKQIRADRETGAEVDISDLLA